MNDVQLFQKMNADVGIEMTYEEAATNYAACITALSAVNDGHTIEEAIDMMQQIADESFHPGVCRKFLTEAQNLR